MRNVADPLLRGFHQEHGGHDGTRGLRGLFIGIGAAIAVLSGTAAAQPKNDHPAEATQLDADAAGTEPKGAPHGAPPTNHSAPPTNHGAPPTDREPKTARPEAPAVTEANLEWSVPGDRTNDCTSRDDLARAVETILARPLFVEHPTEVTVKGSIQRVESGRGHWRAELDLVAGGHKLGSRMLESDAEHCSALNESLALVIAVALESLETTPRQRLEIAENRSRSPGWRGQIGIVGQATAGLLPGIAPGAGLWTLLEPAAGWHFEAELIRFAQAQMLTNGRGAGFEAWETGLSVCPQFVSGPIFRWYGCVDGRLVALRAMGQGLEVTRTPSSLIPTAGITLAASINLARHWAFRAALGGEIPFLRDRFFYGTGTGAGAQDQTDVHRVGVVFGNATLGLAVNIP